jgi:DNA-binding HxlR family transcriptional regulator
MSQAFATPLPQAPRPFTAAVPAEPGRDSLNRLLGQPIRSGILRALCAHDVLSFSELKRLLRITDGNLSMHARKLEDARLVACTKGFRGRFPRTEYRLTDEGRQAFEGFLTAQHPA